MCVFVRGSVNEWGAATDFWPPSDLAGVQLERGVLSHACRGTGSVDTEPGRTQQADTREGAWFPRAGSAPPRVSTGVVRGCADKFAAARAAGRPFRQPPPNREASCALPGLRSCVFVSSPLGTAGPVSFLWGAWLLCVKVTPVFPGGGARARKRASPRQPSEGRGRSLCDCAFLMRDRRKNNAAAFSESLCFTCQDPLLHGPSEATTCGWPLGLQGPAPPLLLLAAQSARLAVWRPGVGPWQ